MIANKNETDAYGRKIVSEDIEYKKSPLFKSSYDSFFDGYSTKTILNKSGKPTNVRVYTGTLFHQEISGEERLQKKCFYVLCLLGAISLLIGGFALPVAANSNIWCFITAVPSLVMYFRLLFALIAYLPAEQDFKLHEYKDGAHIIANRPSLVSYSPALPALTSMAVQLNSEEPFSLMYLLYIAMLVLSGILIAIMGVTERKIIYTIIPED